ncbi:MAG: phosphonopyruvate decarboxylase [Alphaproteobacteria bacterium]|nr:phosphonopyruvate decarboxylase [Alphaproteobacteria bacterium]
MNDETIDWRSDIFNVLRGQNLTQICHVPDAGHAVLIDRCVAQNDMTVISLTTEEEGVGVLAGAWLGGDKGVLLMQSSGVGNTINALALPQATRMPFLAIITMRGEWGEVIPWQVPMGQATPAVLEAMGVKVFRAERAEEVGEIVAAAAKLAYNTNQSAAVLLSQRLIGAKEFN